MTDEHPFADIGFRIHALRIAVGMEPKEFAKRAGVGTSALNQWESGDKRISVDAASRIVRDLPATLDYIYLGDVSGLPVQMMQKLEEVSQAGLPKPSGRGRPRKIHR